MPRKVLPPIAQHLAAFTAQRRVQAASLVITLFGDAILARGGRVWLGSVIRLLQPLGLSERLVRTAVFRLTQAQWLRSESHGRRAEYVLTEPGRRRFYDASEHIYAAQSPTWDRRWRLLLFVGEMPAELQTKVRRSLFWQGFGSLSAAACIHPSADLDSALDALGAEGLHEALPYLMPLLAAQAPGTAWASASAHDLVSHAWDLVDLALAYRQFCQQYQPLLSSLQGTSSTNPATTEAHARISDETACLLRLLLIHDYRRLLLRDPELPDELLPSTWPAVQARALCRSLYRQLLAASERHLDAVFQLADGSVPPADGSLALRFLGNDPLHNS